MQARKTASVALAVGACALGFWFASSTPHTARSAHDVSVAPEVVATRAAIPTLAIGAVPAANTRGVPFALTRTVAEAAVRAGVLHIATADGRDFDVAIERNTQDAFGNWHVIGRVQTRIGPQAMVATFGKRAVFAVLPTPDGRTLEVATDHGATTIAEAGSLIPEGMQGFAANNDAFDARELPAASKHDIATSAPTTQVQLPTMRTGAMQAIAAQATGEVTINVLGLYGPDLVEQLGDEASVHTEIAHMLAVANQAHVDSGSRIRLALSGLFAITNTYASNQKALIGIESSYHADSALGVDAARWTASADLVFLARPHAEIDASCGASFRIAESTGRNTIRRSFAFAVANLAPCSPYALSHELGHLLGNAHDRDTEAYENNDVIQHGVLPYASGYRQFGAPAFATVMADPSGLPTLNVFSSPFSSACGAPCGVADEADEVRSMNSIAGEIAGFAGTPGMATFNDAAGFESAPGESNTGIEARVNFNGPKWPNGGAVQVEVVGGTATQGVDYTLTWAYASMGDLNSTQVFINTIPDDIVEPDETVILRAVSVDGVPFDKDTATITILNDDPRPVIRGALRSDGVPINYYDSPYVQTRGSNGNRYDNAGMGMHAESPNFTYAFPVVRGTSPMISIENVGGFGTRFAMPIWVPDVRGDVMRDITYRPAFSVIARGVEGGNQLLDIGQGAPIATFGANVAPPGQPSYVSRDVPAGARLTVYVRDQRGTIARVFDDVHQNIDVTLAYTPTTKVFVSAPRTVREGDAGVRRVRFDVKVVHTIFAPYETITLDWRTRPGTATEGEDFVAASGTLVIPAEVVSKSDDGNPTVASMYVDILGDQVPESPEWLELELTSATEGVEVVPARTKLTLRDDDHRASTPTPAEKL